MAPNFINAQNGRRGAHQHEVSGSHRQRRTKCGSECLVAVLGTIDACNEFACTACMLACLPACLAWQDGWMARCEPAANSASLYGHKAESIIQQAVCSSQRLAKVPEWQSPTLSRRNAARRIHVPGSATVTEVCAVPRGHSRSSQRQDTTSCLGRSPPLLLPLTFLQSLRAPKTDIMSLMMRSLIHDKMTMDRIGQTHLVALCPDLWDWSSA